MNKTLQFIVILLLLLLPALYLMVKQPLYPSHDGLYHIERIKEFNRSLLEKQFPPRLAPTILNEIGYPLFVVNYQTPYYISDLFLRFSDNAVFAFKSTIAISFILCAVFSFLLFKEFSSNLESLTGAIIFSYLPYRFANIYSRGSLGESVSLMFVPLILFSLHKIGSGKNFAIPLLALSVFGLITSHTVIFIVFLPLFIFYPLTITQLNKNILLKISIGSFLGFLASSFQIIPSIFEKKYLTFDQNLTNLYLDHFLNIMQTLRIPSKEINTDTPFQFGLSASLITVFATINILKNKRVILFLFLILLSLFLTNQNSIWLWQNITPLKYVLYPWRFLSLAGLSTAFVSVLIIKKIKYKTIFAVLFIVLTIFSSRHYFLKPTLFEPNIPTNNLTTQNEYNTIWSNDKTFLTRPLITKTSNVQINDLSNKPFQIIFQIHSDYQTEILIRKLYFPGWHVKLDNVEQQIIIKDGLISVNVPSGEHKIYVYFEENKLRKSANLLTLLSLALIIYIYIKPKIKKGATAG